MNDQLIREIVRCPNLPSLPAIAVQVLQLTQSADVNLPELARLISKDPALSTKILRNVNSSFYARSHNVSTISQAVVILGLQSVKTLVLGFSLVRHLKQNPGSSFDYMAYWRRSIYAANAARTLAARMGVPQQEEAFVAALLQDIGMLVLDRVMGHQYSKICGAAVTHADLPATEAMAMGMTHAQVGELLANEWKLPPVLAVPIAAHHAPDQVEEPGLRRLAEVVSVAGTCAEVFVSLSAASAISEARRQCLTLFTMTPDECDGMLDTIGKSTREIASLFDINIGTGVRFDDVLKRANEALVEITLKSQQQADSLRQMNQQLQRAATTDALTGLANRGRFDRFLADQFALAHRTGQPMSLILLDLDRFKSINDRFGHPVGDLVLKSVARRIASAARASDLAARYGGEEIALVLPMTSRATATAIADRLRQAIAAQPVVCPTAKVPVTASFGVACVDPSLPFKEPHQLLKAADIAAYAAKQAGRNCVKVFSRKPAGTDPQAA